MSVVVRGNGFNPATGGWTSVIVGDRAYTAEEVAAAVGAGVKLARAVEIIAALSEADGNPADLGGRNVAWAAAMSFLKEMEGAPCTPETT